MSLVFGLLLLAVVALEWFTQQVTIWRWGPWQLSFHRDEWPACFWSVIVLQVFISGLLIYWFFA
jgi:hypothetical protein